MYVLLQGEEYLLWVDRLDEIVRYFLAYSLVHDVLLLALGDHHDGCLGLYLLDTLQRLKAADARHHLVEKYKVKGLTLTQFRGVKAVIGYYNIVTACLKEYDVGVQMLYLIIYPKDFLFQINELTN